MHGIYWRGGDNWKIMNHSCVVATSIHIITPLGIVTMTFDRPSSGYNCTVLPGQGRDHDGGLTKPCFVYVYYRSPTYDITMATNWWQSV